MRSRIASAESSLPAITGHPNFENRVYSLSMRRTLQLHPSSTCTALDRIDVQVARHESHRLSLAYFLSGDIDALRLSPASPPKRGDKLWQSSCFEAFVTASPGKAYCEFNFAPSLKWAAYRFDGYRKNMREIEKFEPLSMEASTHLRGYELSVSLNLNELPDLPANAIWHVGLSAVIEEKGGGMSYWALAHPPGRPDFHHADCFQLGLPPKG
jgi:hypothetical protein